VVMTRVPLAGAEVYEWIALRRVSIGGVTKVGHRWLESGHRIPGYVTNSLAGLLAGGLVMLRDTDPTAGDMGRAALTNAGTDRYEQLCQKALRMPAAQFIALCRRFVDDDPDPFGGMASHASPRPMRPGTGPDAGQSR
jgi:hypothetical protein